MEFSSIYQDILLFKKQRKLSGISILEVITTYCEELDKDIDTVGEMLKKDKSFRTTFEEDLKFHNEAKFQTTKRSFLNIEEWV